MAISLSDLKSSRDSRPPRVLVHGTGGVGKTTFAACAPKPVFIWTEEGAGMLDVQGWGPDKIRTFQDVLDAIGSLYTDPHDYQTLVVDSLDQLEPLVWAHVCKANSWASIEAPGYGKGYVAVDEAWRTYLSGLDALRNDRGMTIVQIAHSEIMRFENPETDPYDRYRIKLHKRAASLLQEQSDVVGFINYRVATVQSDAGFGAKIVRGTGSGERVLYLAERPAFVAKNRYAMPASLVLPDNVNTWDVFKQHVPQLKNPQAIAPAPTKPTLVGVAAGPQEMI